MTAILGNKSIHAWAIALLLATTGCVKTIEEDYTAFHGKRFSSREQPAEVFTGDTAELLASNYLLIGYVDFTHNALSCYDDYTCSADDKSHMTMDFLRSRSSFRGADQIQIIESDLTLKPTEKSVCTATSVQASFVNGVLVTTTVCSQYTNYDGFTESWQKRALLWRYAPDLATAELNYEAVQKALPKLVTAEATDPASQTSIQPFARLLEDRFDEVPEANIYAERLVVAIQADNTDFLLNELNGEALRNYEQQQEISLLALAYQMEKPVVYRWLIEQELDWASTPANYSMLDYAIVFSSPEDVSLLLKHHPYLERDWSNSDSIYIALAYAQHIEMLDFILARGFSINGIVKEEYSLVQLTIAAGNNSMARDLIEKGVSLKPVTTGAISPLLAAIYQDDLELVKLLLDKAASLDDTDNKGNSAIHVAAAFAQPEVVQLLLDRGADINQRNREELSPVYLSIFAKNWDTAEAIMQLEVDYEPPAGDFLVDAIRLLLYDAPATSLAIFLDKTQLLRISSLRGLIENIAVGCASYCKEESMSTLLDNGINANFSVDSTSLFSYAHKEGNEEAMIALIKHGYREHNINSALTSLQYALVAGDLLRVRAYRLAGNNNGSISDSDD